MYFPRAIISAGSSAVRFAENGFAERADGEDDDDGEDNDNAAVSLKREAHVPPVPKRALEQWGEHGQ